MFSDLKSKRDIRKNHWYKWHIKKNIEVNSKITLVKIVSFQFKKGIGDRLASIYKPAPFSRTIPKPEKLYSEEVNMSKEIDYGIPEPKKESSGKAGRKPGESEVEYMKRTGQQSTLDAMRRSGFNDAGRQMSVGPQQGVTNAIRAAAAGQTYISPSGNEIKNYTPANANMTDASTGLPVVGTQSRQTTQSQSQSNPFKKVWNRINNWF